MDYIYIYTFEKDNVEGYCLKHRYFYFLKYLEYIYIYIYILHTYIYVL